MDRMGHVAPCRRWGLAVLVATLAALPLPPARAQDASEDPALAPAALYHRLRQTTWSTYELAGTLPRDLRGVTVADDLRTHGLTRERARRLEELLAATTSTGAGGKPVLDEAASLAFLAELTGDAERLAAIVDYWMGTGVAARVRDSWGRFLAVNGLPPNRAPDPPILALERRLGEQLAAGEFETASRVTARELAALYGEARVRISRELATDMATRQPLTEFRERQAPCTADGPQPPSSPPYPAVARRRSHEGSVVLRRRLSPEGCTEAAAVMVSSGYAALDDAAVDWVLRSRPDPAFAAPTGGTRFRDLRVSFRLDDQPPPAD